MIKTRLCYIIFFNYFPRKLFPNVYHIFLYNKFPQENVQIITFVHDSVPIFT